MVPCGEKSDTSRLSRKYRTINKERSPPDLITITIQHYSPRDNALLDVVHMAGCLLLAVVVEISQCFFGYFGCIFYSTGTNKRMLAYTVVPYRTFSNQIFLPLYIIPVTFTYIIMDILNAEHTFDCFVPSCYSY